MAWNKPAWVWASVTSTWTATWTSSRCISGTTTPALYLNDGKGNFRDLTIRSGLGVETRYVSWGAGIVDLDNDGNPDIFWVTGNIYPEVEKKFPHVAHRTPRVLFRNLGKGQFEELIGVAGPGVDAAALQPAVARLATSTTTATWIS